MYISSGSDLSYEIRTLERGKNLLVPYYVEIFLHPTFSLFAANRAVRLVSNINSLSTNSSKAFLQPKTNFVYNKKCLPSTDYALELLSSCK